MAARTRVLQLAIAIVNLTLIGLAFTSIWPFPHGDFRVHLPSANNVSWSYESGVVKVTAPYSIDNGGFYDVDNLVIGYTVTNGTRFQLAGDTFDLGKIPKGSTTSGTLDFSFDLLGYYKNGTQWMVFHDDIIYFDIHVSCLYTMKLVKFDARYSAGVVWDALIKSWAVEKPSSLPSLGTPYPINYWLNTSRILSGLGSAHLNISLYRDSTLMGYASSDIALGGNHNGTALLNLIPGADLTVPGSITLRYVMTVVQYSLTGSWTYSASGGFS